MRQEFLSDIPSGDSPGQRKMESGTESPEADISVVEDHGGPELYQFELLPPSPERPIARALGAKAVRSLTGWPHCTRNVCRPLAEWLLHYASTIINESLSGNVPLT